jgi:PAS domain S-box-containing protein
VLFSQGALQQENNESMKLRFLSLDGTILPAYITLSPLEAESSSDLNLLQFSSNSLQNMQEFVYVDSSNHQYLINEIEQVVFHLNVNQQIIFLNQSWESQLDYKVQDSLNRTLLSFIHPEDRPLAEARINSLIQGKRNKSSVEIRLISRDGESHWMELRAKNTSAYKGERSSVIGTLTDISHIKATEASLRSNRHLLTTLINNTAGMMYRCKNDQHWSFEFVSDGCVEVTGYEPYEMINNPNFSYMQIIHADDRQPTWEVVQRNVSNQQKFQVIYRIVNRSGAVKWVWEQGKGVFSSSGELLALEGFITDISNHDQPEILEAFQALFFNPSGAPAKLN